MSLDPDKVCCKNCVFYQLENKFCRRFPPTVLIITNPKSGDDIAVSKFPVITFAETDWCGEFDNKENFEN